MTPLQHYLALATILFFIGAWGMMARRNIIMVIMCIELMLNAVNISLVAFSNYMPSPVPGRGEVFVFFVFGLSAAEAAVGLGIAIALYRLRERLSVDELDGMKG
ncbi:MAG: NADH-quinone oxidoreductase subunit NuoK [Thermoleophilia bacterium]|nr:NADH-quinone oxidoreductase subunit NuoK [Thermoleophilia bacterium]